MEKKGTIINRQRDNYNPKFRVVSPDKAAHIITPLMQKKHY